ncbi:hypothetical protein EYF80_031356 [Liparis tanakae]|uniref:Uncharacterized protein n=1 Tax=Liparis tanakae TaxID=230148 RepID=A0A4Z2GZ82_9TELE|nr:hypothetical protein EYF80_031356 [Liparis tanakae]
MLPADWLSAGAKSLLRTTNGSIGGSNRSRVSALVAAVFPVHTVVMVLGVHQTTKGVHDSKKDCEEAQRRADKVQRCFGNRLQCLCNTDTFAAASRYKYMSCSPAGLAVAS